MRNKVTGILSILLLSVSLVACSAGSSGGNNNNDGGAGDGGNGEGGGNDGKNGGGTPVVENTGFVNFETGQVRPLAISNDGQQLYAVNTPDSSLQIYNINSGSLEYQFTVPVGLEPAAVAQAANGLVWVVNHLSDSISIVDVSANPPKVVQTLLVGDEPRDIVFAGNENRFAFVTTAHRGQNGPNDQPIDPKLTESTGRADVWVFDTNNLGTSMGGDPVNVITFFGDTPRALTASVDGSRVYVAVFMSGNKTTTIGENLLSKPVPLTNVEGLEAPDTGLIVKNVGNDWIDGDGNSSDQDGIPWSDKVFLTLPDFDVFEIDASVNPPVAGTAPPVSGVGTTLFNMITNPQSGVLYVTNTEALNHIRFEGPGLNASTVRGHFTESRITVIDNGQVSPRHLNKAINYNAFLGTAQERALALANPLDMAISSDGNTLYVTGFGSQKIGIYNTAELENNTFQHTAGNQVALSAGGPSGVVVDESNNRLYVLTRFDNGISIVNTETNTEIGHIGMFNPEPSVVKEGRKFLYDATITSSHGDSSCALCHVFGDMDGLAWDLGNPDEIATENPNPFATNLLGIPIFPSLNGPRDFHPMKGPMTTQSLRGLKGNGPMHWRGDRTGSSRLPGESVELGAFKDFNAAFPGLLGRDEELSPADMQAYAEFALTITYPPNPIRALDNSFTPNQLEGRDIYLNDFTTGGGSLQCNNCHTFDPADGHFGTSGLSSFEGGEVSQDFKVPHLRNMYQKVGKFGGSGRFLELDVNETPVIDNQIKGFGFMHDGAMDTLGHFLNGSVFEFDNDPIVNEFKRDQVIDFVFVMGGEMAPIVGQQVTLNGSVNADVNARLVMMMQRALVTSPRQECDLIVKGVIDNQSRGGLMVSNGVFQMDRQNEIFDINTLRNSVSNGESVLTFTCVPPGSGRRMGLDHNLDGVFDSDET